MKKSLILFLVSCLCLTLTLCLGVSAESADKTPESTGMDTYTLVSLIIAGALILLAVVLCIVKRKKLVEGVRSYKSEMKKITWFPWKSVWRCTIFVIVSILVIAFLVGILDIAFFEAQGLLTGQGFGG